MRQKDILIHTFEDIKILQQYLYMSEDHFIEVENTIGVKLQIRMGEDLHYYCKRMDVKPAICWSEDMTIENMINIIGQLKEIPATEFPDSFKNRWDELKQICTANIVQNKIK